MTTKIINHSINKKYYKNGNPITVDTKNHAEKIAMHMFTHNLIPNLPKRKLNQYVQSWSAYDAGDHWKVIMHIADR